MAFPRLGGTRAATGGVGRGGRGTGGGRGGMFGGAVPDFEPVPKERRGQTVRRILVFFKPYRPQIAVVLAAILVTSFLGLVNPILLKLLIDVAIPQRDLFLLNLFVVLMIALPIVSGLIGVGQSYLNNLIGQRVMQDLRAALYAHLQRMPLRFFTDTRTGEIQSRLANDVGGVQSVVTDTARARSPSNFAIAISTVIAMWLIDWRLTLLSLGLLPFFMYLTFRVGKVRREVVDRDAEVAGRDVRADRGDAVGQRHPAVQDLRPAAEPIDRVPRTERALAALQIRQAMVGRWFFMIIGTIFTITPAFVYWLAGWLTIQNDPTAPTIGDIVAFTTLQSRLFFPLGQLLNVQVEIQGALALFDRIFEYLEMTGDRGCAGRGRLDTDAVHGQLGFRDVSFRYPTQAVPSPTGAGDGEAGTSARSPRQPPWSVAAASVDEAALESLVGGITHGGGIARAGDDAHVRSGAHRLRGGAGRARRAGRAVGSGKTTTTYLIPRLYDVDAGAVEIDGIDVRKIKLASLGRIIGVVTQETYLFHASVRDNLLYARPDATEEELVAAARAAAMHDRVMELPEGYDTIVGERGYKLSGGEKQRIAIARVLLKDPRILILDEATSALDTVSERLIQAAFERLMEGRTTVAIAHRLSTILRADRILVYDAGPHRRARHARRATGAGRPLRAPVPRAVPDRSERRGRYRRPRGGLSGARRTSRSCSSTGAAWPSTPSRRPGTPWTSTTAESNTGASPVETVLSALGSCSAMDVVGILAKKRQDMTAYRIQVTGLQRDEYPQVYTEVTSRMRSMAMASPKPPSGGRSSYRPSSTAR